MVFGVLVHEDCAGVTQNNHRSKHFVFLACLFIQDSLGQTTQRAECDEGLPGLDIDCFIRVQLEIVFQFDELVIGASQNAQGAVLSTYVFVLRKHRHKGTQKYKPIYFCIVPSRMVVDKQFMDGVDDHLMSLDLLIQFLLSKFMGSKTARSSN